VQPCQYNPTFSDEDIQKVRELCRRHSAPHTQVQRAKVALLLIENPGIHSAEVARRLAMHEQTVRKWRKRWTQRGFQLEDDPRPGRPRRFSPVDHATVIAIACELPAQHDVPLSRFSLADIKDAIYQQNALLNISKSTIWRWLTEHVIHPWQYRSWIFPRDPEFLEKATRVLDLYEGFWEGKPLGPDDYIISADEKTSIQAREGIHGIVPPGPGRPMLVEHEYHRHGALAYLAALDVSSGQIIGRVDETTGIKPFMKLVRMVMGREPYRHARRVFWVVDNGSSHRPNTFPERLHDAYPNAIAVHLPIHASWLNQIEIFFSIIQRKLLTPNYFAGVNILRDAILRFQSKYNHTAQPFNWHFTASDLKDRLATLGI
jgi:transposase